MSLTDGGVQKLCSSYISSPCVFTGTAWFFEVQRGRVLVLRSLRVFPLEHPLHDVMGTGWSSCPEGGRAYILQLLPQNHCEEKSHTRGERHSAAGSCCRRDERCPASPTRLGPPGLTDPAVPHTSLLLQQARSGVCSRPWQEETCEAWNRCSQLSRVLFVKASLGAEKYIPLWRKASKVM